MRQTHVGDRQLRNCSHRQTGILKAVAWHIIVFYAHVQHRVSVQPLVSALLFRNVCTYLYVFFMKRREVRLSVTAASDGGGCLCSPTYCCYLNTLSELSCNSLFHGPEHQHLLPLHLLRSQLISFFPMPPANTPPLITYDETLHKPISSIDNTGSKFDSRQAHAGHRQLRNCNRKYHGPILCEDCVCAS